MTTRPATTTIRGAPDLVIEVVLPFTVARDRSKKLHAYHQAGVPWYWLVEAESLLITGYRHTAEGYLVSQITPPADVFTPALFPGLALRLADLFGEADIVEQVRPTFRSGSHLDDMEEDIHE